MSEGLTVEKIRAAIKILEQQRPPDVEYIAVPGFGFLHISDPEAVRYVKALTETNSDLLIWGCSAYTYDDLGRFKHLPYEEFARGC